MTASSLDDWTTPWLSPLSPDALLDLRGAPPDVAAGLRDRVSGSGDTGWCPNLTWSCCSTPRCPLCGA